MSIAAVMVAVLKALVVLSILVLIIGLIKPKWVLFWMRDPSRLLVSCVALLLFMGSMTGYSQLTVQPKPPSERERTEAENNAINLGRSVK
jgi:hypothetical protein